MVNRGCLARSVTDLLMLTPYDHSCHRSNGIRSDVMAFTSGRTFDPNPACIDLVLGRMFFDSTHGCTTTTIVGAPEMLDLYDSRSDVPICVTAVHCGSSTWIVPLTTGIYML